jgi:hypothetical protein
MSNVPLRTLTRWSLIDLGGSFPPAKRISSIRLTGGIPVEIVSADQVAEEAERSKITATRKPGIAAWKKYAAAAAVLVIVSQFYYFRELAAALLIFTILFLTCAAIVGVIYLVGRAGQKGISIAEPAARRGMVYAEGISRKTFHRPRSVPVP